MLSLKAVTQFKKDIKKYQHKKPVLAELEKVILLLKTQNKLPEKHKDHFLICNYSGMRECHIKPDVLLVYWIDEAEDLLYLERIGSHSELF